MITNIKANEFSIKRSHFANFVLADEIKPNSSQSTIAIEGDAGKHVTIGDTTFKPDRPFLVLATQNPVEQEGTYQLPEVRGSFIENGYRLPKMEDERLVIRQNLKGSYEK
jgi:MoxR-like ATPase